MTAYFNYFIESFNQSMNDFFNAVDKGFRAHRAYEELNQLTDRELRDLGMSRYDIPRVISNTIKTQAFR